MSAIPTSPQFTEPSSPTSSDRAFQVASFVEAEPARLLSSNRAVEQQEQSIKNWLAPILGDDKEGFWNQDNNQLLDSFISLLAEDLVENGVTALNIRLFNLEVEGTIDYSQRPQATFEYSLTYNNGTHWDTVSTGTISSLPQSTLNIVTDVKDKIERAQTG